MIILITLLHAFHLSPRQQCKSGDYIKTEVIRIHLTSLLILSPHLISICCHDCVVYSLKISFLFVFHGEPKHDMLCLERRCMELSGNY